MATNTTASDPCRSGILSNLASPVACTGGNYTIGFMFADAVDDSNHPKCPPGFTKRVYNITGKQLCDGAGVLHAGALRIKGIQVMDSGMCPGIIGIKELTPCQENRALPTATRATLTNAHGMIAGHHLTGCGSSTSFIPLHESLGRNIPGCLYTAPSSDKEVISKANHLTCRWADWIGTDPDKIAHTCIESKDSNGEPIFGIPLAGKETDCLSKFTAEMYRGNQLSKVKAVYGDTVVAVKTSGGLPMLRITGADGLAKVNAAKAELARNMAPDWLHHGFQVAHYAPEGTVMPKDALCKLTFERCTNGNDVPVTLQNIASDSNIQIQAPITVTPDSVKSIAAELEHMTIIPTNEVTSAVERANVAVLETPVVVASSNC